MSLRKYILGAMNQVPRFILLCCVTLSLPIIAWAATTVGDGITITAEDLTLDNTTYANQYGVIYKGGERWIHDFNYGDNGTVTTDGKNIFIGGDNVGNFTMGSTATNSYEASYNIMIGDYSLHSNTIGYSNIAMGQSNLWANTTGSNNLAIGVSALHFNSTGNLNTAIGYVVSNLNDTGGKNVGLGAYALYNSVSGSNGVAMGYGALYNANDTATPWTNYNTAIGYQALNGSGTPSNNTGNYNTALGYQAIKVYTTGNYNTGLGVYSLVANNTGSNNTAIGYQSGNSITSGAGNTIVGYDADLQAATDDNEIVIGASATGLGSNTVVLGNSSVTTTALRGNVGIGITAPAAKLDVDGGIRPDQVTADPCGAGYPEGTLFYNDTSDYFCFCDGNGDDLKVSDNLACF